MKITKQTYEETLYQLPKEILFDAIDQKIHEVQKRGIMELFRNGT